MNKKHKPFAVLVPLLMLVFIFSVVCNACSVETNAQTNQSMNRFTQEYVGSGCSIITDNQTGVQYLAYVEMSNYGRGVGLTRLEVGDGN